MADLDGLRQAVIEGDTEKAVALVEKALKDGVPAADILNKSLVPGMQKVGALFSSGEYYLPELLLSGEAMKAATEALRPSLSKSDVRATGRYLIGTVQGDVHDIGKNIVIMMLEGNGWEVTDLGVDVSPEDFCKAVKEGDYDVLGLSALLTLTLPNQKKTIEALRAAGLRGKIRVMVGGATLTRDWADEVGADEWATDAVRAVEKARRLVAKDQEKKNG